MESSQPSSTHLVRMLANVIGMSQRCGEVMSIPSILIPEHWIPEGSKEKSSPTAARVLAWFHQHGLHGDRTMSGWSQHRYPRLFRELGHVPPWINVELEDVENEVSEERARQLQPLYMHCEVHGYNLLDIYRAYLEMRQARLEAASQLSPQLIEKANEGSLQDLKSEIDLVRILGQDTVEDLLQAIFAGPEFEFEGIELRAAEGAPDLFLWYPGAHSQLWFFAEVKGPKDSLRGTQYHWIQDHWDAVRGRVLLVIIGR